MLNELCVMIHEYLLKGSPFTMDVTRVAWPLVQTDRVLLLKPGQWPQ